MVKKLMCLFGKQWSELICKKFFILILFQVLGISLFSQPLFVNTSISNGIHNYVFSEGITDSSTITVFAWNPFQSGGPCEFRVYDHSLNLIKKKEFVVTNDDMAQSCGAGYSVVHESPMRFYPRPADSCIYITTNLTHNYGTCQQVNGLVLIKMTSDFDTIWSRQYTSTANGSIPFNDSTLLFYGTNDIFNVKFANGDTVWARRSNMRILGAFENYADTSVIVYGSNNLGGPYHGIIRELSSGGNYNWGIEVHDSLMSQVFGGGFKTSDSCFVMLMGRYLFGSPSQFNLIKIDRSGNKIWEKAYNASGFTIGSSSIIETSDGGFLIAYRADVITTQDESHMLLKTDSLGNIEWNRKFPGTNYTCQSTFLYKIMKLNEEKLLITGGNLIQTDSSGNACFFTPYNILSVSNGNSYVVVTPPLATIPIPTQQNVNYNIWSNKFIDQTSPETYYLDSCFVSTAINDPQILSPLKIYSNPSSDNIIIETPDCAIGTSLIVFNLLGEKVCDKNLVDTKTILTINDTGPGVFVLRVQCGGESYFSKIVFYR